MSRAGAPFILYDHAFEDLSFEDDTSGSQPAGWGGISETFVASNELYFERENEQTAQAQALKLSQSSGFGGAVGYTTASGYVGNMEYLEHVWALAQFQHSSSGPPTSYDMGLVDANGSMNSRTFDNWLQGAHTNVTDTGVWSTLIYQGQKDYTSSSYLQLSVGADSYPSAVFWDRITVGRGVALSAAKVLDFAVELTLPDATVLGAAESVGVGGYQSVRSGEAWTAARLELDHIPIGGALDYQLRRFYQHCENYQSFQFWWDLSNWKAAGYHFDKCWLTNNYNRRERGGSAGYSSTIEFIAPMEIPR